MKRVLVIVPICLALAMGAWLNLHRPKDKFSYGQPAELKQIPQTNSECVLADALTWRRESQNEYLSLKVKISFKLEHDLFWVRFQGVDSQQLIFRKDFIETFLATLNRFDDLAARLKEQDRRAYRDQIQTLLVSDTSGQRVSIPVYFVATPRFVTFEKKPFRVTPSGQACLMEISLPFPLERAQPFERTEVRIDELGLRQLRKLLEDFKLKNEKRLNQMA